MRTFEEAERLAKAEAKKHALLVPELKERFIWQHTKEADAWVFILSLLPPTTQSFDEFLKKPCLDDGPDQRARDWLSIHIASDGKVQTRISGDPNELWPV